MKTEEDLKEPAEQGKTSGRDGVEQGGEAGKVDTAASTSEAGAAAPAAAAPQNDVLPHQGEAVSGTDPGSDTPPPVTPPPKKDEKGAKKDPLLVLLKFFFRVTLILILATIGTAAIWHFFKPDLLILWQKYHRETVLQVQAEKARKEASWKRDAWEQLAKETGTEISKLVVMGDQLLIKGDAFYEQAADIDAISSYVSAEEYFSDALSQIQERIREEEWLGMRIIADRKKAELEKMLATVAKEPEIDSAWVVDLLIYGNLLDHWENDSKTVSENDSVLISGNDSYHVAGNDSELLLENDSSLLFANDSDLMFDNDSDVMFDNDSEDWTIDEESMLLRTEYNDSRIIAALNDSKIDLSLLLPKDKVEAKQAFIKAEELYRLAIEKLTKLLAALAENSKNSAVLKLKELEEARGKILLQKQEAQAEVESLQSESLDGYDPDERDAYQEKLKIALNNLYFFDNWLAFCNQRILGGPSFARMKGLMEEGENLQEAQDYGEANNVYRAAFKLANHLGAILIDAGEFWQQSAPFRRELDLILKTRGKEAEKTFAPLNRLFDSAKVLLQEGDIDEAMFTVDDILTVFRYRHQILKAIDALGELRKITGELNADEAAKVKEAHRLLGEANKAYLELDGEKAAPVFQQAADLFNTVLALYAKRMEDEKARQAALIAEKERQRLAAIEAEIAKKKRFADEIVSREKKFWQDPVTAMEFVWVEGGCFQMGSNPGSHGHELDEEPVHEACVDGFWFGKYEVTQGQWNKIMGRNPAEFGDNDNFPVERISWDDAKKFAEKIGEANQKFYTFRLPTEAEWEYAARAGTSTYYYFGDKISTDLANFNGAVVYENSASGIYRQKTTPVGSFPPNAFGLYDMHGNVYEWCEDWYDPKFYRSAEASKRNPLCLNNAEDKRVLRGGSWYCFPWFLRSANRFSYKPIIRLSNFGVRLIRRLEMN